MAQTKVKKRNGVLFIEKNLCQVYTDGAQNVLTYQYPPNIIQDLEIIQLEEFHKQLLQFLAQNNLPPTEFVLVLGNNLFFVKDVSKPVDPKATTPPAKPGQPQQTVPAAQVVKNEEEEVQTFLSNVPFENVSFKVFKTNSATRILATNRDLFEAFKRVFEQQGHTITEIIPSYAFEMFKNVKLGDTLTPNSARAVLKDIDSIKQQSMLVNQMMGQPEEKLKAPEPDNPLKNPKKRMMMYGGIFSVLILVLGYLVVTQFILKPEPTRQATQTTEEVVEETIPPSQIVSVSEAPVATNSASVNEGVSIQIISSTATAPQVNELRDNLTTAGFTTITTRTTTVTASNTQIVFQPDVPETARQELTEAVTILYPNTTTTTNAEAQFDAIITLASTQSASLENN